MLQENWHYAQPQRTHINLPMRDCSFNFFEIFRSEGKENQEKEGFIPMMNTVHRSNLPMLDVVQRRVNTKD